MGTEEEAIGVRRRMKIRGKLLAGMNLQTETWRSTRNLSLSQGEGHRNIKSLRKYCSTPRMSHWQPPELWGQWWWWCFENPLELRFSSLLQMGYITTWAPATSEIPHDSCRTYRISCQLILASNPLAKSSSQGEKLLFLLGPCLQIILVLFIPWWIMTPEGFPFHDTWRISPSGEQWNVEVMEKG